MRSLSLSAACASKGTASLRSRAALDRPGRPTPTAIGGMSGRGRLDRSIAPARAIWPPRRRTNEGVEADGSRAPSRAATGAAHDGTDGGEIEAPPHHTPISDPVVGVRRLSLLARWAARASVALCAAEEDEQHSHTRHTWHMLKNATESGCSLDASTVPRASTQQNLKRCRAGRAAC